MLSKATQVKTIESRRNNETQVMHMKLGTIISYRSREYGTSKKKKKTRNILHDKLIFELLTC